jgi:spore maturation protein CgeB
VKAYSAADVVLNVSYGFGGPPGPYGTMANVRVFEALACGACQVVDAKRDVAALFRDGEHLVLFRTAREARERIVALLADAERRRRIGARGRSEVLARHTWRHRVARILEDAGRLPARAAAGGAA